MSAVLLTPNEVAILADASRTIVEKALEQRSSGSPVAAARAAGSCLSMPSP
jgi:hypothetical protein